MAMCYYVFSALNQDPACQITDVLLRRPDTDKYKSIKALIMMLLCPSEIKRAVKLQNMGGLGEHTLFKLMSEMLDCWRVQQSSPVGEPHFAVDLPEDE
ncbi:hypothetical protein T11_6095 [Trichinella zimbabwensis]|uniref:Uncharacterized protein n=1 Tax=Trichinella zimbabwensis TaxID=268475 RepID=A0A0V1GXI3_9BILA|nr:hypothetical protein T11_6095 [Trichinella zimbabwensis]